MEYMDYIEKEESHGMLRSEHNILDFYNTTSPTPSPTEAPAYTAYSETEKTFIGMFMIFPFAFAILTGAVSGTYIAIPGKDTAKFHVVSKSVLFGYSILTSAFSVEFGGDKVDVSSHVAAIAWILASVPVAFSVVEGKIKDFAKDYFVEKDAS